MIALILVGIAALVCADLDVDAFVCTQQERESCRINKPAVWARSRMVKNLPTVPVYAQLPRVSVDQLSLTENAIYKERVQPFILTGAMDGWNALTNWVITPEKDNYLGNTFPNAVCDFYPYNMLKEGMHPHLIHLKRGLRETMDLSPVFDATKHPQYSCTSVKGCTYLHLQLTPSMMNTLELRGDVPKKRHKHVSGDQWWMRRCMPDQKIQDEFHLKTHWKIILIGTRGSGMFNHSDSLLTSSWHGHVQGRKWWYVCSPAGVQPQICYESVLNPGEVLYYGSGWYHATRNLDQPSMTITGTSVHQHNFEKIADKLHSECTRSALSFDFSGSLCDALDMCYPLWAKYLSSQDFPARRWKPWREVAQHEEVTKKDMKNPTENNYDGRNYIFRNEATT